MAMLKKISFMMTITLVMVLFSVPAVAQLPMKKPGTIKEQIANSSLFNGDEVDKEIADILDYASKFKGTRYCYGSTGPKTCDCSGFTSYVFSKFGYRLHRTSGAQVNDGVIIAKNELQPGDLVFFNGRRAGGSRIGHVGIVTSVDNENETFEFIHASSSQGVVVSKSTETYFNKRYVKACRVIIEEKEEVFGAGLLVDFGIAKQEDCFMWNKH